jgi:hypothetical protein
MAFGGGMGGGIYIIDSSGNRIFHNDISIAGYGPEFGGEGWGNNTWDNGYPSGGNYWSDYQTKYPNATEIDSSGIWNTPYVIDGPNNIDRYPLMHAYFMPTYSVSFSESGLSSGTQWWVDLSGDNQSSTSNRISFSETDGTYTYSVGASSYIASLSSGTVTVNGTNVNQAIAFTQCLSTITIIPYSKTLALVSDASHPNASAAIGYANITGDLWNIADSSVGSVSMTINQQGILNTSVGFTNANTRSNSANIIGYPHVVYGYSPWAEAKTAMSKALELPISVDDFPQLVSLANYSINWDSSSTPLDFAYDIWITQNQYSSGCGVGDLELMIWTDNANNLPVAGGGTLVASKQLSVYLGTSTQPITWNIYVRNGNQSSASFTTVYIVLGSPISSGTVGVDIHQMIDQMIDALVLNYPKNWNKATLQNYWVEDIELGSEFGLDHSKASYSWSLNNYCYFLNYPPLANGGSSFTIGNTQSTSSTETTTIESGSASLNQLSTTGISVSISGSSASDGTSVSTTSTDYGTAQPSGTGTLQVHGVAFYDVKTSSSASLGSTATAIISITNPDFSAQDDIMSFWNGSSWVTIANIFILPDTVCGNVSVSVLTGTPIMIGSGPAVVEFPSLIFLPLFMIATLIGVMIFRKKRKVAHVTNSAKDSELL